MPRDEQLIPIRDQQFTSLTFYASDAGCHAPMKIMPLAEGSHLLPIGSTRLAPGPWQAIYRMLAINVPRLISEFDISNFMSAAVLEPCAHDSRGNAHKRCTSERAHARKKYITGHNPYSSSMSAIN